MGVGKNPSVNFLALPDPGCSLRSWGLDAFKLSGRAETQQFPAVSERGWGRSGQREGTEQGPGDSASSLVQPNDSVALAGGWQPGGRRGNRWEQSRPPLSPALGRGFIVRAATAQHAGPAGDSVPGPRL